METQIGHWLGRPIEELSRDELFDVIKHLNRELERYRTPKMINAIALGEVAQLTGYVPKSMLAQRLPA